MLYQRVFQQPVRACTGNNNTHTSPFGALSFAAFEGGPINLSLCDCCAGSFVHELVGEERIKNAFGLQVELHKAQARNAAEFSINRLDVEHLTAYRQCITAVTHGQRDGRVYAGRIERIDLATLRANVVCIVYRASYLQPIRRNIDNRGRKFTARVGYKTRFDIQRNPGVMSLFVKVVYDLP